MIPKFRAYSKWLKRLVDIDNIDFKNNEVDYYDNVLKHHYSKVPFDNVEVMQSTSLKDKNGKEIFEGDIVTYDINANDNYLISYDNGSFVYMGDSIKQLFDYDARQFFVIGNIYENKEFLDVK